MEYRNIDNYLWVHMTDLLHVQGAWWKHGGEGGRVGNERHGFETSNTLRFILSEIFHKDHSTEVKEDSKHFIKGSGFQFVDKTDL